VTTAADRRLSDALTKLAANRRDKDAWETVYRQMRPFVYGVVYRRLRGDQALAEDATQEVFLRLVRSFPFSRLRDVDAFRGYVWRVGDNVALTYRRRIMAHPTTSLEHSRMDAPDELAIGDDPTGDIEMKEILNQVWQGLGAEERRLLRLLLAGHSIREVASALRISYTAAGVRVWRLRMKLRKLPVFSGIQAAADAG
jgi:RNA polymerase sigma factor (sigma-70 family)